jgi:hypothetical protein
MTVATALAVSWKPFTNSKPKATRSVDAQQNVRQSRTSSHLGEVTNQIPSDVNHGANRDESEDERADQARALGEFFANGGCCRWRGGGGRRCSDGGHERLLRSGDL